MGGGGGGGGGATGAGAFGCDPGWEGGHVGTSTATPSSGGQRGSPSLVCEAPPITGIMAGWQTTAGGGAAGLSADRLGTQVRAQHGGGRGHVERR